LFQKCVDNLLNFSDLFAELCTLLCGCGHFEKAVALFQAELDFVLYRPSVLSSSTPHKDAVDFMSVYWDSSAPKFGEDSFQGWASWVESGGQLTTGQFWYSKGMYHVMRCRQCIVLGFQLPHYQLAGIL